MLLFYFFFCIYQDKQLPRQDQIRDLLSLCLYRMHKYIISNLRDRNGKMVCANLFACDKKFVGLT